MPFIIVRQDITKMQVDAIVNAANTRLLMGGGVCGAIFSAAGPAEMQAACDKVAPIRTGQAAITPGFRLPAKYVIHAAGPVYSAQVPEESAALLRSAYTQSLRLAAENGCESIAFPLISSGIYGYPKAEALQVATAAITDFLAKNDMTVYLAVFDKASFTVSERLMGEVASYIDEHYIDTHSFGRSQFIDVGAADLAKANAPDLEAASMAAPPLPYCAAKETSQKAAPPPKAKAAPRPKAAAPKPKVWPWEKRTKAEPDSVPAPPCPAQAMSLEDALERLDEPFSEALLRLIDSQGKTDVEVYKRANIDRKLFSKIRSVKGYTPRKSTILALAIALELSLSQTEALLRRAGYALSPASKFDVIVEYFIVHGRYNIYEINEVLFQYDQPLLGA